MDLYLIRHADAVRLGEQGIHDDEVRPLTDEGRTQARQLAGALQKRQVKVSLVLTSPLLRARQTAEEMLRHWTGPAPELRVLEELRPETRAKKLARAVRALAVESAALVGHQPYLPYYLGWFIGSKRAHIDIAKAGVAHIAFPDEFRKGKGILHWLVPPAWQSE